MKSTFGGNPVRTFAVLFFVLLCSTVSAALGACHAVGPSAAGNGSGDSWQNRTAGVPTTLVRGDIYYLMDGTYGSYSFNVPTSGTTPVTMRKATVGNFGRIEDGCPNDLSAGWDAATMGSSQAVFSSISFSNDFYNFDGVVGGGPNSWSTGHGFKIARAISSGSSELVTLLAGADNITISHTEITALNRDDANKQAGIKGTGGNRNLRFSYNNIHTLFGVHFHMGNWENVVIEFSRMARNRNTPEWHTEGISSIGTNTDVTIRHNLWDEVEGTAVFAGVNTGTSNNWKIYGNVISRSVSPLAYYYEGSPSTNQQTMNNLEFYNNVLTRIAASQGGIFIQQGSNNKVFNNIWYDNDINSLAISATKSGNYFSRNIRTDGCSPACERDTQGAAGDALAQITSVNPFKNWTSSMDAAAADFRLQAATNQGVTLSSPFDRDPLNALRGGDGVWDRGAYEFPPASNDVIAPAPPTNLRIENP